MTYLRSLAFVLLICLSPLGAHAKKTPGIDVAPRDVTYCELSKDPAAYNHALVRITTFVTHGFEDFHLADPECRTQGFSVWVMYGGKAQSDTIYCCPGEAASKTRPKLLTIEGIQISLIEDSVYQKFRDLLSKEPDTTVHATLTGRFFSGEKQTTNGLTSWGGAGHLGCCSLFVIERVESFDRHSRRDLDYTSEAGWYEKEGCKFGPLLYKRHVSIPYPEDITEKVIAEQESADSGARAWAFADAARVAMESLKPLYPGQTPILHRMKQTSARQVFRWRNGRNQIVIVVTRPYWLSYYAASRSVVWVATMIKEAGCD